jgi:hypothetical protein
MSEEDRQATDEETAEAGNLTDEAYAAELRLKWLVERTGYGLGVGLDALPAQRTDPVERDMGMAIVSGWGFAEAIKQGAIPPDAALWVNRYMFATPWWWFEATDDFLRAAQEPGVFERSGGLLDGLLTRIGQVGANLSEIQAAEEAVTLHLTAATIYAAQKLRTAYVEAHPEPVEGTGSLHWSSDMDGQTWVCCETIREHVQPVWLGMLIDQGSRHRSDLAFGFVRLQIDSVANGLLKELRGEPG